MKKEIEDLKLKIKQLEDRVQSLEARPIFYPFPYYPHFHYYPTYQQYPQITFGTGGITCGTTGGMP